jgi:hypothetical protein
VISYHPHRTKNAGAFAAGFKTADTDDVDRLIRGITRYVWSPCIWEGGRREQARFLRADWLVLDFDSGETTLAEACRAYCDMIHIIGTTKSHQKVKGEQRACDRFRVMVRFERPVENLRDYRFLMTRALRRSTADPSAKDGARFFYPCTEIVQASYEGMTEEVLTAPENFERPNLARFAGYARAGVLPSYCRRLLTTVVPIGARNKTWYGLGKDLARCGMSADEIVRMVVMSSTYEGKVGQELLTEIARCVGNGASTAEQEMENTKDQKKEAAEEKTL